MYFCFFLDYQFNFPQFLELRIKITLIKTPPWLYSKSVLKYVKKKFLINFITNLIYILS